MTGPAHSVETSYEPHRNLITGVVNGSRFAAEVGSRKSEVGRDAGAPGTSAPAADSGPSTKHQGPRTLSSYLYANDLLGRRETISQGGEAFGVLALGENRVEVAYNDRSEVVGSVTRRGDIPVARHTYAYDAIGNRQRSASEVGTRAAGRRSESGSNRKSAVSYEANALNQYAEVKTLSVDSVNSVGRPVHDPDGNLIEDARHQYTWNADNNLVRVESKDGSLRLDYVYDHQSRRTVRIETRQPGTKNEEQRTTYYLYDDWNLLADVSAVTGDGSRVTGEEADAVRYYTWGRDLSGSLQGAGGVGGLLAISEGEEHRFPAYDANGNIGQLLDNAGAIVAAYAYDPFGNVTEMAGAEAAENPWRFSTKPVETGTGWSYYGFRYYMPDTGRWASRDPLGDEMFFRMYSAGREFSLIASMREESLKMPYGFVSNDPLNQSDTNGLWAYKKCGKFVQRTLIGAEERFGFPGAIASRFLAPHSFIVTDDGELLDYFGSGGDDHWTATSWPLMIPKCLDCDEYTSCLKAEYSGCSSSNPDWSWTNNCNSYVADAISRCNKKLFTAEIITQSYLNKCCDEND